MRQSFGQPVSINRFATTAVAGSAAGTYTVTSTVAIPATQTGTLRVMMDGHPAGDVTTAGTFTDRLAVKSVFKDFAITGTRGGATVGSRHRQVQRVPRRAESARQQPHRRARRVRGLPQPERDRTRADEPRVSGGVDGKLEESIDFKTMIHAIHAGQASKGGFRTKGITIYGFGGSVNDFSTVVFPGKLNNCTACHVGTSYQLTGIWAPPTANGILGTTISTEASASDPADNLRITPTAAVCSSCHDSAVAKAHMQDTFNGGNFSATQAEDQRRPAGKLLFLPRRRQGSGRQVSARHTMREVQAHPL